MGILRHGQRPVQRSNRDRVGQFKLPGHLSLDSAGNVYVADTYNNRLQEFSGGGTFITSFGTMGSGNGQLVYPEGAAVDSSGSVYVADTGSSSATSNNRIEVFAPVSGSVGGATVPVDKFALLIAYLSPVLGALGAVITIIILASRYRYLKRVTAVANCTTTRSLVARR